MKGIKVLNKKKSNKDIDLSLYQSDLGITLIALVITIIILLILAGITIATLMGDNGLLARAVQAQRETKKSQYYEEINLEILDEQIERVQGDNSEPFIKSIKERIEEKSWVNKVLMYKETEYGLENETDYEKGNILIVQTKDDYEIIIEVNNTETIAKIRDYFEKIGKDDNQYTIKYDKNGGERRKYRRSKD